MSLFVAANENPASSDKTNKMSKAHRTEAQRDALTAGQKIIGMEIRNIDKVWDEYWNGTNWIIVNGQTLTTTQRDTIPAASKVDGTFILNSTLDKGQVWDGSAWKPMGGDPDPMQQIVKRWGVTDDNVTPLIYMMGGRATNPGSLGHGYNDGGDVGSVATLDVDDADIGNTIEHETGGTINNDRFAVLGVYSGIHSTAGLGNVTVDLKKNKIDKIYLYIQFKALQTASVELELYTALRGKEITDRGTYSALSSYFGIRRIAGNWILYSRTKAGVEVTADTGIALSTVARRVLMVLDATNLKVWFDNDQSAAANASLAQNVDSGFGACGVIIRTTEAVTKKLDVAEIGMGYHSNI